MKHIRKIIVFFVLGLLSGFFWIYINKPPDQNNSSSDFLDIKKIKILAREEKSMLALSVNFFHIASVADWSVFKSKNKMCVSNKKSSVALQINYDSSNALINVSMNFNRYNTWPSRFEWNQKISQILSREIMYADNIVFTETGPLWMDKIATDTSIYHTRDNIKVFYDQLHSRKTRDSGFPPAVLETIEPIVYNKYTSLMPGMVLIRPEGLRKESQWIYLKLQNGKELLIVDCFLPSYACIKGRNLPSRLWLWRAGYHSDISPALDFLHKLHKKKKIQIIMSCDIARLKHLQTRGFIFGINNRQN